MPLLGLLQCGFGGGFVFGEFLGCVSELCKSVGVLCAFGFELGGDFGMKLALSKQFGVRFFMRIAVL